MKHQRIKLSTGLIDIYDEAVPRYERVSINEFTNSACQFTVAWSDQLAKEPHLFHLMHPDNPMQYDLIRRLKDCPHLPERLDGLSLSKSIINLSSPSSIHHMHCHSHEDIVILYYINNEWEQHWEGETMFYSETGEIELASQYTPGRLLVFDAKMPHSIRAQSPAGPPFRFSLSMFWKKDMPKSDAEDYQLLSLP